MRTEDDRSPLDPMGGPTPFDIISDAKGVLDDDDPRLQAEEALVGRGLPERRRASARAGAAEGAERHGAPRTFEEHIKEATGQFPTVDGEELDPAEAQASHARRAAARREAAGRSGEVAPAGRAASGRIVRASAAPGASGATGRGVADDPGRSGGDARSGGADATGPGARVSRDAGAAGAGGPTALDGARRRAAGDGGPSGAGRRRSRAAAEAQAEARRRKRARRWLVVRIVLAVLAVVAVAVAVAFSCFRWLGGDDAQDIQGIWFVNGTDSSITITGDSIVLTDAVSYRYDLDEESKTISFSFSRLTGDGHYRFSLDRESLAIIDGEFTWGDTLTSDFGWTVEALLAAARGESLAPASGKNVTLLTRTSASARAAQQTASQDGGVLGAKVEKAEGGAAASAGGSDAGVGAGDAGAGGSDAGAGSGDANAAGGSGSDAVSEPVYDPDKPLEPGGNAVDSADAS